MKGYFVLTAVLSLVMLFFPFLSLSVTPKEKTETVSVLSQTTGDVTQEDALDYIVGVVAAEMPALYETEALKAQAVASYTYLKWIKENADNPIADITNSEANQVYKTKEQLKELWGENYDLYYGKIENAVKSVYGEYLTYKGETALTVYHAVSPSKTESAENIWGRDLPYLSSVVAPGDSLYSELESTVSLTEDEFKSKLQKSGADFKKEKELFKIAKKTDSGFVKEISSGGKSFDQNELRSIFSLKSPFFILESKNGKIIFTCFGKGHGIGMSQNSADYMARQNASYREILSHFYNGTQISD